MSWRRDLDLLHGEEVDIVLKPHPLSFTKHHIFFVTLLIIALLFWKFYFLFEENASLLSVPSVLDVALNKIGMKVADMIFLVSFGIIIIISGGGWNSSPT